MPMAKLPIDQLRGMVRYFGHLNETFNQAFTREDLWRIYTFTMSEQGAIVHELADHWPADLLHAVLTSACGAKIDEAIVKRASEETA